MILAQPSKAETEIEPLWLTLCDAPYREVPTVLRLCRYRGMRHTGTKDIALLLGTPESRKTFWGKEELRDG